jgi:hypothetical protein
MKRTNFRFWLFSLVFIYFQTLYSAAYGFHPQSFRSITSADSVVIPFTVYKGLIFIEAKVDGKRGQFMLDTGSPTIFLNSYRFSNLAKSEYSVTGVNGNIKEVHSKAVQSLDARQIKWENFDAVAFDMTHLEQLCRRQLLGLLGYSAFKNFEMMIDYEKKELTLFRLDKRGNRLKLSSQKPLATHPFKMAKHLPVLNVVVDNFILKLGIDTGAEVNLLHKKWERKLYNHFLTYEEVQLSGGSSQKKLSSKAVFDNMSIENQRFIRMQTLIADLSHLINNYHINIDGLLGYEFLSKGVVSMNFKKKELYFWKFIENKPAPQNKVKTANEKV